VGVAPTFTDGNVVHQADLAFALDPPRVQCYQGTGVSCTNSTFTLMTFDTDVYDTDVMHDTSSVTSRVVFKTAGTYLIQAYSAFGSVPTAHSINVRKNSGGSNSGGSSLRTHQFGGVQAARLVFDLQFSQDDYIEVFVLQTSGGSLTTSTGNLVTGVTARWVAYQ
jgi:hypothetical protein